jgi:hypothetical protein
MVGLSSQRTYVVHHSERYVGRQVRPNESHEGSQDRQARDQCAYSSFTLLLQY